MWGKFKSEGTEALVDKRWGAAPRKRTTEREADVLRVKALDPERGDSDLAAEFGLERSAVYRLLKEHGLQDLHRVLEGPVILETQAQKRIGIYTTASHPRQAALDDQRAMTTIGLMDAMRFKQRIENHFKFDKHEMKSDAIIHLIIPNPWS